MVAAIPGGRPLCAQTRMPATDGISSGLTRKARKMNYIGVLVDDGTEVTVCTAGDAVYGDVPVLSEEAANDVQKIVGDVQYEILHINDKWADSHI